MTKYGDLGVGCEETGVYSTSAHNQPDQCSMPTILEQRHLTFINQIIASCSCMTKTPEWSYHDKNCPHRLIKEIADYLSEAIPPGPKESDHSSFYHLNSHEHQMLMIELTNNRIKMLQQELEAAKSRADDVGWQIEAYRQELDNQPNDGWK